MKYVPETYFIDCPLHIHNIIKCKILGKAYVILHKYTDIAQIIKKRSFMYA